MAEKIFIFIRTSSLSWRKLAEVSSMEEANQYWRENVKGRGCTAWTEFVKESDVTKFLNGGGND